MYKNDEYDNLNIVLKTEFLRCNIKETSTLSNSRSLSNVIVHMLYKNPHTMNNRVSFRNIIRVHFSQLQPYLHLNYFLCKIHMLII